MKTTLTSGQLQNTLTLLEQKGVTPERFQTVLSSGLLSDIFDPKAILDDRDAFRVALKLWKGLPPSHSCYRGGRNPTQATNREW
jgi:hypothetical protein